eukprot:682511-Rhodomonas_salina.1
MIKSFHVEATLDTFNVVQQLFFLAPGQRLVYSHNFSGMYNDISQVTYFHYPDYVRLPQARADQMREKAMQSLPCVGSIVPAIGVMHDDDNGLPFGSTPNSAWTWVVSAGRVYLWDAKLQRLMASR